MFEKTISFIFWLVDIFSTSRDPFLAEYRGYWRKMVIFSIVALLGSVCTMLTSPTEEPVAGWQLITSKISDLLYLGASTFTLAASIAFLWTLYQYWIFTEDHGTHGGEH